MDEIIKNVILTNDMYTDVIMYIMNQKKYELLYYVPVTQDNILQTEESYKYNHREYHAIYNSLNKEYVSNLKINNLYEFYEFLDMKYKKDIMYLNLLENNLNDNIDNIPAEIYYSWLKYSMPDLFRKKNINLCLDYIRTYYPEDLLETINNCMYKNKQIYLDYMEIHNISNKYYEIYPIEERKSVSSHNDDSSEIEVVANTNYEFRYKEKLSFPLLSESTVRFHIFLMENYLVNNYNSENISSDKYDEILNVYNDYNTIYTGNAFILNTVIHSRILYPLPNNCKILYYDKNNLELIEIPEYYNIVNNYLKIKNRSGSLELEKLYKSCGEFSFDLLFYIIDKTSIIVDPESELIKLFYDNINESKRIRFIHAILKNYTEIF